MAVSVPQRRFGGLGAGLRKLSFDQTYKRLKEVQRTRLASSLGLGISWTILT